MKLEQLALAAAAVAILFWPQIQSQLSHLRRGAVPGMAPPSDGGRSQWVAQLLALQEALAAAGRDKAAAQAGQLVVEIVSGQGPQAGAKK